MSHMMQYEDLSKSLRKTSRMMIKNQTEMRHGTPSKPHLPGLAQRAERRVTS